MPSFELNRLQGPSPVKPVGESDRARIEKSAGANQGANAAKVDAGAKTPVKAGVALDVQSEIDSIEPPVDADRVSEVREALRSGNYPLVPAQIVDGMIAARLSFELGL